MPMSAALAIPHVYVYVCTLGTSGATAAASNITLNVLTNKD